MIVLHTNIISELMKETADRNVERWVDAADRDSLFLSTIVLGELLFGAKKLAESLRRRQLIETISSIETRTFANRILVFNANCAHQFSDVVAKRRNVGRPIGTADAQIAATALAFGMSLATRNTRDFDGLGLELINPFGES